MCAFAGALLVAQAMAAEQPKSLVKVKVFVAAMFEIGKNTGDRAGEFQHWYERYWMDNAPIEIRGALNPVYCNPDGVCGAGSVGAGCCCESEVGFGGFTGFCAAT